MFQGATAAGMPEPYIPRDGTRLFDGTEIAVIVLTGLLISGLMFWSYERSLGTGLNVEHARSMALATLILAGAGITASLRPRQTLASIIVIALAIGSAVIMTQIRWMAELVHVQPLHRDDWLIAASGAALCCIPLLLSQVIHADRYRTRDFKNPDGKRR
ncbi:MAG TPA: cation transporting ATPase C-terminal domain-containing protein [Marinobacter sp.]|nr:cation transporting ATPase C-terminal domain-containing protein [Marinobacter sp.]